MMSSEFPAPALMKPRPPDRLSTPLISGPLRAGSLPHDASPDIVADLNLARRRNKNDNMKRMT